MGGQTNLTLEGVFFMPNSDFTFAGQGAQYQTTAQFIAARSRPRAKAR